MNNLSFHLLVAAGRAGWAAALLVAAGWAGWAAALLALPGHAQAPEGPVVL